MASGGAATMNTASHEPGRRFNGAATGRASDPTLLGVSALRFAASATLTLACCESMPKMDGMEMPGGWPMSVMWMHAGPDMARPMGFADQSTFDRVPVKLIFKFLRNFGLRFP